MFYNNSQRFRAAPRVAVVTGGNKGIGYEVVRGLVRSKQFGRVYLTARNDDLGKAAVDALRAEESADCIDFHPLDVTSQNSITTFAHFITEKHGGLDVLVQNAGIAPMPNDDQTILEQTILTLNTNFWGVLNMMKTFEPIIKQGGRIVSISSFNSLLALFDFKPHFMVNPIGQQFGSLNAAITVEQLENYAKQYISDIENKNDKNGWPSDFYGLTKLLVNNITRIYGYVNYSIYYHVFTLSISSYRAPIHYLLGPYFLTRIFLTRNFLTRNFLTRNF